MSRRNNPAKWVLPTIIDPGVYSCVTIPVPDDKFHRAAFWGALLDLASAYKWQDDPTHKAKDVAIVWRNIIDSLKYGPCGPVNIYPNGAEQEDFMPLRVDCDCNVWVTCCDGTEMQLATKAMLDQSTQPGAGTEQPPAGGGCATYAAKLNGNGLWLLPTVVSTGDTIEITEASGATYNPANGYWYCPDGSQFFAGACVPYPILDGANPMPSVPSGRIIAKIGATFYDVYGSAFTVPSGITSQPVQFQVNYADITTAGGTLSFNVTVCNNQAASWSVMQNFELSTANWAADVPGASGTQSVWSAGVGWVSVDCNNMLGGAGRYNIVYLHSVFAHAVTLEHFDMTFDALVGPRDDSAPQQVIVFQGATATTIISTTPVTADDQNLAWDGSMAGVTEIRVVILGADKSDATCPSSGNATLKAVKMNGTGSGPY